MVNFNNMNAAQRFNYIELQEVERRGLRYKLEQSCIGRLILCLFCCWCCDPDRNRWKDHRYFLKRHIPDQGTPEFLAWERATNRMNLMFPYRKPITPARVVRVMPRDRLIPAQDVHHPQPPQVTLDMNSAFRPVHHTGPGITVQPKDPIGVNNRRHSADPTIRHKQNPVTVQPVENNRRHSADPTIGHKQNPLAFQQPAGNIRPHSFDPTAGHHQNSAFVQPAATSLGHQHAHHAPNNPNVGNNASRQTPRGRNDRPPSAQPEMSRRRG